MILTCPNCATRYQADAAKFVPDGRKVRCAKCGHTWHQPAPEAEGTPVAAAVEAAPAAAAAAPEPRVAPEAARAHEPLSVVPGGSGVSSAWRLGALAGWAALIAVVALLAWAAIAFRQGVASVWPQTATVYSWIGLDVNTVGLAFQDVSYRVTSEDDMPVLHIRGKVVNITARNLAVPQIKAALTDDARNDLYDWKIRADAKNLAPGKSASFNARLPSPPSGARHVDLKFVEG
jgi:predicted Zn finger-like uncharacterized protein